MSDKPTLRDALDGLVDVIEYCEEAGMSIESGEAALLYEKVGDNAPESDWDFSETIEDGK